MFVVLFCLFCTLFCFVLGFLTGDPTRIVYLKTSAVLPKLVESGKTTDALLITEHLATSSKIGHHQQQKRNKDK